jgi:hypothetical protein
MKNTPQKIDLMFCRKGNGICVADRLKTENGDYKTIAHIDDRNPLKPIITYRKGIISDEQKAKIESHAVVKYVSFKNFIAITQYHSATQGTIHIYQDEEFFGHYGLTDELETEQGVLKLLKNLHDKVQESITLFKKLTERPEIQKQLLGNTYKLNSAEDIYKLSFFEYPFVKEYIEENY